KANGKRRWKNSSRKTKPRSMASCASTAFPWSTSAVRRSIRLVLFAIALQPFACAAAASLQPARFIALQASVVRVEATRERGGVSLGTGVTVAPAVIVTNCHVMRDAATVRISGGGRMWDVTEVHDDVNHD